MTDQYVKMQMHRESNGIHQFTFNDGGVCYNVAQCVGANTKVDGMMISRSYTKADTKLFQFDNVLIPAEILEKMLEAIARVGAEVLVHVQREDSDAE